MTSSHTEPSARISSEEEGGAPSSSSTRNSISKLRSRLSSKKHNIASQDHANDTAASSKNGKVPANTNHTSAAPDTTTDTAAGLSSSNHAGTNSMQSHKRHASQGSYIEAQSLAQPTSLPPASKKTPPKPLENPLTVQSSIIVKYFVASTVVVVFISRTVHWSISIVLAAILASVLNEKLKSAALDAEWVKEERFRQVKALLGQQDETAEWMNLVLGTVWPLITSDYFVPFIDLLEDALMQQVPPIVHSCRVEDLDQGTVPLRIQSFTVLDSDAETFTRGTSSGVHQANAGGSLKDPGEDVPIDVGDFVNLEVTFAYRSSGAKHGKTNKGGSTSRQLEKELEDKDDDGLQSDVPVDQIHLLIYMAIGLQKIAAVEIPVWCEVLGITGKMRLRLQMVPSAPFVAHVAFCFVGLPKIEISAKPLGKRMVIDAMNLPIISSYVLRSVEAVIKDFIAPKSYTVDLGALLGSGDGPNNVYSLGVIVLIIHQGIDLPAADTNGLSDPFVSVSFARAGKTLFTTRIITKSRDAIWQEVAVLLVSQDDVRDHEKLRMTAFDADRFSADDPLGKVDVSIDKLIRRAIGQTPEPGQPTLFESRTEELQPMRRGDAPVQGKLKYSVGFYRLARPTNSSSRTAHKQETLRKVADRDEKKHDTLTDLKYQEDEALTEEPQREETMQEKRERKNLMDCATPFDRFIHSIGLPLDDNVLRQRKDRKARVKKLASLMQGEQHATLGPPNRAYPSGILAFHIHSIDGLGFEGTQKSLSNSKRLSQKPRYANDDDVSGDGSASKMPNSYVQVVLNDEAIFRSRTKTLNPRPYINAGSERWVSDFETARIDFTVRDQRLRETDPVIGVAGLKLSEVLTTSSRSTQWYTLTGGLGWGKIRITLIWRSVEVTIPKQLAGWNLGVIEIAKCVVGGIAKASFERREAHMMFETVGGRAETEGVEPFEEYESGEGADAKIGFQWPLKEPVRVTVRQRYPNFLYIHLRSDSRVPGRIHKHAHTVVSLSRLIDGEVTVKRVPLFETADWQQFEQEILRGITTTNQLASSISDKTEHLPILEELCNQTNESYANFEENEQIKKIGYLDLTLVFHPGVSLEHKALVAGDYEMRVAYDSFLNLMYAGERPPPKKFSAAKRRKLSLSNKSTGVAAESSHEMVEEDANADGAADGYPTTKSHSRTGSLDNSGVPQNDAASYRREGSEHSGDEDADENNVDEDFEEVQSPDDRLARSKDLHRQHRGAAQVKGFRTLEWIKTNVEDGVGHMKKTAQQKRSKRVAKMESEGVSHF
ncbi:hypothetical protein CBS101457_003555 [Exobasidium rhododendri]|nr:hypothetical protein CBS101457_003555 [Exobasidium rhododendri]